MEATIDWILTNHQIPESLPGAAVWRHRGSQKWCCTQVEPIIMTSHNKHHGGLHVGLGEWDKNAHNFIKENQICLEQFYMSSFDMSLNVIIYHYITLLSGAEGEGEGEGEGESKGGGGLG